jgi:hypothetical protein
MRRAEQARPNRTGASSQEANGRALAIVTFHGGTGTFVLFMCGRLLQGMQVTHYSVYACAASASGRA